MIFPSDGRDFLRNLNVNNSRDWFQANKTAYEHHVKQPAANLSAAITEGLTELLGTEVDSKTFRIHRDVRFSKDKTPYNPYVRIGLWETDSGIQKAMSGPAFYLSIEPEQLTVGAGCMAMPAEMLEAYRHRVSTGGGELAVLMAELQNTGAHFDPPALKRVPRGYDKDHPNRELLKRKGLTCWHDKALSPNEPITAETCIKHFKAALPIYHFVKSLN